MSSTIYYKGTLKDDSGVEELFAAIRLQLKAVNCRIVEEEDSLYVEFLEGMSEPLLFHFKNRRIAGFCKWNNPENTAEYFRIFDLFIAVKPFFKSLRVDDDEGAWHEYIIRSKPCKIHLRELAGPAETALLQRDFNGANYDFSSLMLPGMRFLPYANSVYCVIARDFLKVLRADSVQSVDKARVLELANKIRVEDDGPFTPENFTFKFPYMLLLVWIGYCLTYLDKGRVYTLSDGVRGLRTNKLAAQFGILSVFLNIHSGIVNSKHAEMKRFADDYIQANPQSSELSEHAREEFSRIVNDYIVKNEIDVDSSEPVFIPLAGEFKEACELILANENVAVDSTPEDAKRSLDVLVSILDYLGFRYVGPEAPGEEPDRDGEASDIIAALYAAENKENAGPMAAYMKNLFPYLGVKSPELKALSKEFLKKKKKESTIDWGFVRKCYGLPEREFQYLALLYLDAVKKLLTPDDMAALEELTVTKSWWDTVDTIDALVGDVCLRYPGVKEKVIARWIESDNIWLKRISIDFQLRYGEKTDTAVLSRAILANLGTKEFFVNKAIGWSLREYSKTDKAWVRQFVDAHKDALSPLSVKEAGKYL